MKRSDLERGYVPTGAAAIQLDRALRAAAQESSAADHDGTQHDTYHDGPARCPCGRTADYDGRLCCYCAPAPVDVAGVIGPGGLVYSDADPGL